MEERKRKRKRISKGRRRVGGRKGREEKKKIEKIENFWRAFTIS
jgi:hypothetical protein